MELDERIRKISDIVDTDRVEYAALLCELLADNCRVNNDAGVDYDFARGINAGGAAAYTHAAAMIRRYIVR